MTAVANRGLRCARSLRLPIALAGDDLATALQSGFTTIYADPLPQLPMTFGLFYSFALSDDADPFMCELPVGLMPNQTLSTSTATDIAQACSTWQQTMNPSTQGAVCAVSLLQYSSLDPGRRVLLSMDRLTWAPT